ncbi:hypothetical protein SYNTR_1334 [Candidatus Syntrophocurvum alkaliphilum]|uniref:N-acetylmuramoyl-L-alanine amidase n=2 Tax=Candidatus Syntrophocurvum alkaliphilum TaxID=2293317 RepID=A0A6I6DFU7_9FIRM|nr:hypothetical protein SYNTR_1334 [Candidatus Syntrophocurvum alkaliphilum]
MKGSVFTFTLQHKQVLFLSIFILLVFAFLPKAEASVYGDQTLSVGSRGAAVSVLQNDLTRQGFNTYGVDGIFDQNTHNAVENFQRAKGIQVDGIVGSQTKSALQEEVAKSIALRASLRYSDQTLSIGSRGEAVSALQDDLTRQGFNTYGVDGIFGQNTHNAVENFQRAKGIQADGIVGPQTKLALQEEVAKSNAYRASLTYNANTNNNTNTTVSRGSRTDIHRYPHLSKVNGEFGQFRYRSLQGGRIEIDPVWVQENIVTITLPGLNRQVQVHKNAAPNFIHAFTLIKKGTANINGREVPLLSLIETMDGTWVPRHVMWNPSRGLSNHSWGTAIDINAAGNLRYVCPTNEPNHPNLILWEKAFKPAGFSWGNRFNDAMHYEIIR